MIINPIICKKCGKELQPNRILLGIKNDKVISICAFCRGEIKDEKVGEKW